MCVCVCAHVPVGGYGWQREAGVGCYPQLLSTLLFETGSLTELQCDLAWWVAVREPQSHPLSMGAENVAGGSAFDVGSGDPN